MKSALFKEIPENSFCYFVHGYYASKGDQTIATTEYGLEYSSALQSRNYYGVQFHPEKSAAVGNKIIQNFIDI
jgi:glutamine amidotransferase